MRDTQPPAAASAVRAQTRDEARDAPWGERTGRRILVVDDDPEIRQILSDLLELEEYQVLTAADGLEALAALARERVDAILLDYNMPRCDGEEFARRYRAMPGPHAPIILVTASHELEQRCRRVSAEGCLGKPFDVEHLLNTLDRQAHSHEAARR